MTASKDKSAMFVIAVIAAIAIGGGSWVLYESMHPEGPIRPNANGKCPKNYRLQKEGMMGPFKEPICCPAAAACD